MGRYTVSERAKLGHLGFFHLCGILRRDEFLATKDKLINFVFLISLVFISLSKTLPSVSLPKGDPGTYLFLGSQVLAGKTLYVDAWEHKGPVLFFINAFGLWLGGHSRWGVWVIEFLALLISLGILFWIINRQWGMVSAAAAVSLGAFSFIPLINSGNWSEEYSILLNSLVLFAFLQSLKNPTNLFFSALIGSFTALGLFLLVKDAVLSFSAISVFLFYQLRFKQEGVSKQIISLAVGFLIVSFGILYYFYQLNALNVMVEHVFSYSINYAKLNEISFKEFYSRGIFGINLFGFSGWLMALGYILLFWEQSNNWSKGIFNPLSWIFLFALPAEFVAVNFSVSAPRHYYMVWLPSVIFFAGYTIHQLFQIIKTKINNGNLFEKQFYKLNIFFVLVALLFYTPNYFLTIQRAILRQPIELQSPVAQYIQSNTGPSDTIQVWSGWGGLYFLAKRQPASSYIYYPYMINSASVESYAAQYLLDIQTKKPLYIIDTSKISPDAIVSIDPQVRKTLLDKSKEPLYSPPFVNTIANYIYQHYDFEIEIDKYLLYRLREK